jgi:phosphate transport system permease protein
MSNGLHTQKSIDLLAKRHRKERRFRLYGQVAIGIALFSLAVLLATIVERGWRGFEHVQIRLTLSVNQADIGSDPAAWRHADLSPPIRQALLTRFPGVGGRVPLMQLVGLVSSGATQAVRNAIVAQPALVQKPFTIWLPASDVVEWAVKAHLTKATPADARRISDAQLDWLDALRKDKAVRTRWNPYFFSGGDSREPELAGFMGSMVGSLFTVLSCMLVAFPVGVMAAIYLEEFARKGRLTEFIEINISNLAAVPSVVFGLLGLAVFLNLFGIPRSAAIAGGMTLALMILPIIIIATRASLRAIPDSIRDAATALGATKLQVVLHHTFPLAVPGIMTGTILGMARAMGETAPLLMIGMVAFVVDIPRNVLDPTTSMPVQIYLWATSPEQSFVEKTAAGIIVLLAVLITMNSLAIFIRRRFEHRW